jgi:uncharacterized DUF497 family protein
VIYEWDVGKAETNLNKHGVSFKEAATVFLDSLAMTFSDPDHSADERREITIGHTIEQQLVLSRTAHARIAFGLLVHDWQHGRNADSMKKESTEALNDDLRDQYDLSQLGGRVRGKYHQRATSGTNLVLIEPDLAELFPDGEAVNRALRLLANTARAATASRPKRAR